MVASQCGIPLFAPFEGNASASVSSFFPQNTCLGDILKNSGYQNYFVQGANLRFAGKDVFLNHMALTFGRRRRVKRRSERS
jgi:phosphoglycerol transferase